MKGMKQVKGSQTRYRYTMSGLSFDIVSGDGCGHKNQEWVAVYVDTNDPIDPEVFAGRTRRHCVPRLDWHKAYLFDRLQTERDQGSLFGRDEYALGAEFGARLARRKKELESMSLAELLEATKPDASGRIQI